MAAGSDRTPEEERGLADDPTDPVARHRAEQRRLYGAPLVDVVDDLTQGYGLTRASLAKALGLSAPMLSQLASGHRVKMGNPDAVRRLQRLVDLLADVRSGSITAEVALETVAAEGAGQVLTRTTEIAAARGAGELRRLITAAATTTELRAAVELLRPRHPAVARLLEIYGLGPAGEAAAHFEGVADSRRPS